MDYEEMSEPNMRLSRALLIVLVLHIVAVAGIVAFNSIKSREGTLPPAQPEKTEAIAAPKTETDSVAIETKPASAPVVQKQEKTAPKTAVARDLPEDSGKIHTVAKGENPVTIARKLKVSEADLLKLNHIDDPRRLQIGQKLHIPAK